MYKFYQTNDLEYICEELDRLYAISISIYSEDDEEAYRSRMNDPFYRHLLRRPSC